MSCNKEFKTVDFIKSAEIIAVGTEILMGQITNTNASFLAKELSEIGIPSYYQTVVGDNPDRLEQAIKIALERSDTVIMTGGLGPTQDDISMEIAARTAGIKLVLHEKSKKRIESFFSEINRPMVKSNLKQAMLPEDSVVIDNNRGTAPGAIIEKVFHEGENYITKRIILLPGPPVEMNSMFFESVREYLKLHSPMQIESVYVKLFGIGESSAEEKIKDIIQSQNNPTIASYCTTGECMFRVSYTTLKDYDQHAIYKENIHEDKINEIIKMIESRLGEYIYEIGNRSMAEVVSDLLKKRKKTVSFAESCTAGMLTSMLADIPGASTVLKGSVVCYSNQSKVDFLGVSQQTLNDFGAVSVKTADEMSIGCASKFDSDYAVSVTGIAGPGRGTKEKSVGTVFISIYDKEKTESIKLNIRGDRNKIRYLSALNALNILRRKILNG